MISRYQRQRRVREMDAAVHRKMRQRQRRMVIESAFAGVPGGGVTVTPTILVIGTETGIRAFPEIMAAPNSIVGTHIGEVVHTAGGTWIWTGFSWESYIYPG